MSSAFFVTREIVFLLGCELVFLELLAGVEVLHVNSLHHLLAVDYAWFLKLLTLA